MEEEEYSLLFKIILIGDANVGKTNILSRYISDTFLETSKSTVGVELATKVEQYNNKKIKIQIWDTAGQERYKSITSTYYKGAKGAFIVYDITRKSTFDNIDKWIGDLKNNGDIFLIDNGFNLILYIKKESNVIYHLFEVNDIKEINMEKINEENVFDYNENKNEIKNKIINENLIEDNYVREYPFNFENFLNKIIFE